MSRRAKVTWTLGVLIAIALVAVAVWQGSKGELERAHANASATDAPRDPHHFRLTSDYEFYDKVTFQPIRLPKGTELEYVETSGSVVIGRYNGKQFGVPRIYTDVP